MARENPIPPNFRTSMKKLTPSRLVSKGHAAGRYESDIYGNEEGAKAHDSDRGEVRAGAALVIEHAEVVGSDTLPGPVMMMQKLARGANPAHGDWAFSVMDSKGHMLDDSETRLCAGCHEGAPHDYVFRFSDAVPVEPAKK